MILDSKSEEALECLADKSYIPITNLFCN